MTTYALHGLRIASEVALPDLAPAALDGVDVRVTVGPSSVVPDQPPAGEPLVDHRQGRRQYAAARAADHLCFRVPGHADFVIDPALTRVECRADPRMPPDVLPLILGGNVLSFLLGMRGATVVHGGAVEVDDGAVAVIGPSGAGKSTLTAWLCAAGARLVTDDVLRVEPDGTVHRGGGEVRLRSRARPLAEAHARSGAALRRTVDHRVAVALPTASRPRLPLRAVLVPRPRPTTTDLSVARLDAVDAAVVLAGVPRTFGWRIPGPPRVHFTTLTALARDLGVHLVDVPWGPPFDRDVARRLLALVGVDADAGADASSAESPVR